MSTIPFEVPAQFVAKLAAGDLVRYGSLLKSPVTGQIVAHLQETGVAQQALSSLLSTPLGAVPQLANLAVNSHTAFQVGKIGTQVGEIGTQVGEIATQVTQIGNQVSQLGTLMKTLQSLQVATLGLSMVGVGVSVAGFLYMRKRFDALNGRLDQIIDAIHQGFEEQRKAALRKQMSRTKGLIQRAEHAKDLSSPQPEYRDVAAALADQAAYFDGEISFVLNTKGPIRVDLFWQLVQSLMLCNNVRIDCGIRSNELKHTLRTAEAVASGYDRLFHPLTPVSFEGSVQSGLETVRVLRDITDSAVSKPYLIDHLRTRRIRGETYVHELEREEENPLLLLKAS